MVRGKRENRSYTQGELADLQGQKDEMESTIRHLEKNPGTSRSDMIDVNALKKQAKYLGDEIDKHTPRTPRGINKDRLNKRADELREEMQKYMPTKDEMDHPAKNPGAIQKHIKWTKANAARVREYKEIQRRLEPEDPTVMSIEKFRREK